MARYDESWRTRIKSTFAPLPLDALQLKLDKKQQERDLTQAQIMGDLNFRYIPGSADPQTAQSIRDEYRQDMSALQNQIDQNWDLSGLTGSIRDIQRKYNIATSSPLSVSGGSGKGGSSDAEMTNEFIFGAGLGNAEYNVVEHEDASEFYADQDNPAAPAYKFANVDLPVQDLFNQSGGDPRKQSMITFKREEAFDLQDANKRLETQANHWNASGGAGMTMNNVFKGYVGTYHDRYITADEVGGDVGSGLYGRMWNDPEWKRYNEVMWLDGTRNPNSQTPISQYEQQQYAGSELQRIVDNTVDADGNKVYNNIQEVLADYEQQFIKDFKSTNGKDPSEQELQSYNQRLMYELGKTGFLDAQTKKIIKPYVDQASFYDRTLTTKEAWWNKEERTNRQNFYKWKLEQPNITYNGYASNIKVTSDDDVDIQSLNTAANNSKNKSTHLQTKVNGAKDDIVPNLFGQQNDNMIVAALGGWDEFAESQGEKLTNEAIFNALEDQGLIVQNYDGTISANVGEDAVPMWQEITGKSDLSSVEVQNFVKDQFIGYNNLVDDKNQASDAYNQQQLMIDQYNEGFLNSDEGQNWLDNKYSEYKAGGGKLSKNQFKDNLLVGKDVADPKVTDMNPAVPYKHGAEGTGTTYNDFNQAVQSYWEGKTLDMEVIEYDWNQDGRKDGNYFKFMDVQQELLGTSSMLKSIVSIDGERAFEVLGIDKDQLDNYDYESYVVPTTVNGKKMYKISYTATSKDDDVDEESRKRKQDVYVYQEDMPVADNLNLSQAITNTLLQDYTTQFYEGSIETDINDLGASQKSIAHTIGAYNANNIFTNGVDNVAALYETGDIGDKTGVIYKDKQGIEYYYKKDSEDGVRLYGSYNGEEHTASNNSIQDGSSAYVDFGHVYGQSYSTGRVPKSTLTPANQYNTNTNNK